MEEKEVKPKSPRKKKEKIPEDINKPKTQNEIPDKLNSADEEKPSPLAITGMIIGICGMIFCCGPVNLILGIVSVILGYLELNNIEKNESPVKGKNFAIAAIIMGFIGVGLFVLRIIGFTFFWSWENFLNMLGR
ncbi:MAG: DUF4190 domain-containing protein [bacterium]|nr:DUF4190 domain-containing protein [bacterium]